MGVPPNASLVAERGRKGDNPVTLYSYGADIIAM
jgi:hypothetical protein